MDRLELVALGDETEEENMIKAISNLKSFDINNAQCFDPNEELKLRIIMKNIGIKRLQDGLNDIAKMLQDNMDRKKMKIFSCSANKRIYNKETYKR